jgi:hypothetical protein
VNLGQATYHYTHGWRGLVVAYSYVAIFVLGGLIRGKARLPHYLLWPILAVPTFLAAMIALAVIDWGMWKIAPSAMTDELLFGLTLAVLTIVGFIGGIFWSRRILGPVFFHKGGA